MIPDHTVFHQCGPPGLVGSESMHGSPQRLKQCHGTVISEFESCVLVDRVVQTAGGPNHWNSSVSKAVDLVQTARFVMARHEEDVRACFYFVCQLVVELNSDGSLAWEVLSHTTHQRLIIRFAGSENHQCNVVLQKVPCCFFD